MEIEARGAAFGPQRSAHGAAGEHQARAGFMANLDALAVGGEHNRMIADHVTAAQSREADFAGRARTGQRVAGAPPPRPRVLPCGLWRRLRPDPRLLPDGASTLWR